MFKKFLSVLIVLGLVLIPAIGQASIGYQINGTMTGQVHDINFTGPSTLTKSGGALTVPTVDATLIAAGAGNGGATSMATSTTAIPVTYSFVNMRIDTDAAFRAKTLANGKKGQILVLNVYCQEAANVLTVTPSNSATFLRLEFNAVGDQAVLLYVDDTTGWVLLSSTSVTVVAIR